MAIDDEPDILKIVKISLIKRGYEVDAFTDPVAAIDHFRDNASAYSLVLTDIKMPERGRTCKAHKETRPDIKVMVMTALEVNRDPTKALPSIERYGFPQKPFHTADVCVAVRRHFAD